jgi:hypothetical protein
VTSEASSTSDTDPTSAGSQSIKDTAKWLIAALGALGGALVTSLQLKDLGSLTGGGRTQALIGFGIAIAGVLAALVMTALVLSAKVATLQEMVKPRSYLNSFISENPELLAGFKSIEEISDLYTSASKDRVRAYLEMEQLLLEGKFGSSAMRPADTTRPSLPALPRQSWLVILGRRLERYRTKLVGRSSDTSGSDDEENSDEVLSIEVDQYEAIYKSANNRLDLVNPVVTTLLNVGLFEKTRRQWKIALPAIVLGMMVAGVGTGLFATADVSTAATTPPALEQIPEHAVMDLTASGKEQFAPELGASCPLSALGVIVLDTSAVGWDLVTDDQSCTTVRLIVPINEAVLESCTLPSLSPPATTLGPSADDNHRAALVNVVSARAPPTELAAGEPPTGGPCPPIRSR